MYSYFESTDFQGENLQGADFQGANLQNAQFQSANLGGARFQGADLKDAKFQSANLHETNFKGAKLQGANFKECKVIEANWSRAEYNSKTHFPASFNSNEYGLIKKNRRSQSVTREFGEQSIDKTNIKIKVAVIEIRKSLQKRQGQKKFRKGLIKVYEGRCAITVCKVECVLKAAHIKPYHLIKNSLGEENNSKNGILLRADLHTIFDLNLLVIHPQTKKIEIKESLQDSEYKILDGRTLRSYQKNIYSPDDCYLELRCQNYEEHIKGFVLPFL